MYIDFFFMEERILISPDSCTRFLSNLVTSHRCADKFRSIRIRNWNELITT